ncbi:MAG: hypothetical protein J7K65_06330 [Planctomycetes bacterium]|nr:hypothetical protein [Planctomycetota bacterium]
MKAKKTKKGCSKKKKLNLKLAIEVRDALKARILGPQRRYYLTLSSS